MTVTDQHPETSPSNALSPVPWGCDGDLDTADVLIERPRRRRRRLTTWIIGGATTAALDGFLAQARSARFSGQIR